MSRLTEEDKLLFEQAILGVKPINLSHLATFDSPKPKAKKLIHQPIEPSTRPGYDRDIEAVGAHQNLLFHRKGLRLQDLAKLRKGEFNTSWQLDLHGLTEESAEHQLLEFIQHAYQAKSRYALVIHGKGYNSDTDYPILKNLVNHTLRQLPNIVGFCSALPKDGGTGAVYVMLKAH